MVMGFSIPGRLRPWKANERPPGRFLGPAESGASKFVGLCGAQPGRPSQGQGRVESQKRRRGSCPSAAHALNQDWSFGM